MRRRLFRSDSAARPVVRRRDDPLGGLAARLPPEERILWQGRPDARALALRALHLRGVALYLCATVGWFVVADHAPEHWRRTAAGALCLLLAGGAALGLLAGFALLIARSTIYTLTDRRIVLRFGVALTISVNLPLSRVQSASLRLHRDGSGDIPLRMEGRQGLGYVVLWPHARPWRLSRPEPMLRALPNAAEVAALLSEALAGTVPAPVRRERPVRDAAAVEPRSQPVPA